MQSKKKDSSSQKKWMVQPVWILSGAVLGMVIAGIFAGVFHLPRNTYLVPYSVLVCAFLYGYLRWSSLDLRQLIRHHWAWGLVGALVVGFFVVHSVLRQPSSPVPRGFALVFDLFWLGLVYGTVDALLLSVLPVYAMREAFPKSGWTAHWPHRMASGALALVASLFVVAAYHLGYPEFRGSQVLLPVFGVGVMSLAYIVTGSPISAVLSHIAMHIASVLHGLQTVVQLPPHY